MKLVITTLFVIEKDEKQPKWHQRRDYKINQVFSTKVYYIGVCLSLSDVFYLA